MNYPQNQSPQHNRSMPGSQQGCASNPAQNPHLNPLDRAATFCRDAKEAQKKGLFMPIHPRSLNWWIASLLLVIPLVVIPARAEVKQGNAVVMTISGQAESVSATGSSRILKTGDILKPGDTIKTGTDSEVDLLLEHIESTVGLSSGSILKLERLSYEDTRYGRISQTRLGLAAGELSGKVHKQLAGARFEVVTPKEVASVRGTTFFINSQTGDVHVTEGTVMVKVRLVTASGTLEQSVTVSAGQSLFIPNQFASEAQAKGHCATDTVVWANLSSKVYHFSGHRDYGNTKRGAYMCEGDATQQGFRAAKNEKHPS